MPATPKENIHKTKLKLQLDSILKYSERTSLLLCTGCKLKFFWWRFEWACMQIMQNIFSIQCTSCPFWSWTDVVTIKIIWLVNKKRASSKILILCSPGKTNADRFRVNDASIFMDFCVFCISLTSRGSAWYYESELIWCSCWEPTKWEGFRKREREYLFQGQGGKSVPLKLMVRCFYEAFCAYDEPAINLQPLFSTNDETMFYLACKDTLARISLQAGSY